jgi:Holliday junction resolvase-like predicted endonuclease
MAWTEKPTIASTGRLSAAGDTYRWPGDDMKINKSTRHAKITGDFGETVVLYWLSKYGFEVAPVDHTGIDIIARNPHTQKVMGISVKSRSRTEGAEEEYVSIPNDNFQKAEAACSAFGCVPYFAIVVDGGDTIRGFILPMAHLLRLFPKGKTASGWKMSEAYLKQYVEDPQVKTFEFKTKTTNWW